MVTRRRILYGLEAVGYRILILEQFRRYLSSFVKHKSSRYDHSNLHSRWAQAITPMEPFN